jgi:transcription-repair coupling factor (superfamily II helicase)
MLDEITDRFGKLPPQAQALFDVHRLRVLAKSYGVAKIDAGDAVTTITFAANAPVDPARIIELVQKNRFVRLAGNDKLRIEVGAKTVRDRVQLVRDILRSLGQPKVLEAA